MKLRTSVLLVLLVLLTVVPAFAHEDHEAGEYAISFGWRNEPAYAGMFNGPEVFLSQHDAAEGDHFPADITVDLQAEVTFGPETMTIRLEPAWNETGHYIADLIPTMPGDYRFRIFGTIADTAVDVTFDSADGAFSSVEPSSDIMFPSAGSTDLAALLQRIADLEARVTELEAK